VTDTFTNMTSTFCAMIEVDDIDHFDLVDDPFVVACRTQGGTERTGAFDPMKRYTLRPLSERQEIRDHYILATLDTFLKRASRSEKFAGGPFSGRGVSETFGSD
jgi:hypothetical protein